MTPPPCTCTHADKDHCKGGVKHPYYKQHERKNPDAHTCTTRHCTQPLCSCLEYKECNSESATIKPTN